MIPIPPREVPEVTGYHDGHHWSWRPASLPSPPPLSPAARLTTPYTSRMTTATPDPDPLAPELSPPATPPEVQAAIPPSPYGLRTEPDDATVDSRLTEDGFMFDLRYDHQLARDAYRLGYSDGQDATRRALAEAAPATIPAQTQAQTLGLGHDSWPTS